VDFVGLVRTLSAEAGIELSQEPVSPVRFKVGGVGVVISREHRDDEDSIVLHSELGEVPTEREVDVYRLLLEANLMWSGTADATIGVNSTTRQAVACYRVATKDLEGPRFVAVVAGFVRLARGWRELIAAVHEEIAGAKTVPPQGMIAG
jgi:hypothetical protein